VNYFFKAPNYWYYSRVLTPQLDSDAYPGDAAVEAEQEVTED
jgi:hypothetical protein